MDVKVSAIIALVLTLAGSALGTTKMLIQKNGGFEDYLAAAMIKKHVPVEVVTKQPDAD